MRINSNCSVMSSVLLLIGLVLSLDGIILLALHEIHFGVFIPLVMGLTLCAYVPFRPFIQKMLIQYSRIRCLWNLLVSGLCVWLASLMVFAIVLHIQIANITRQSKMKRQVDAILVLGCGVKNGQASPMLVQRLNVAAQQALQHPQAPIIVSGGMDFTETHSEAEVMAQYLQQNHTINPERITLETQSTSTAENLKFSQKILQHDGLNHNSHLMIITSDFHSVRAATIARHQGYKHIQMVPASTPLFSRYNAWLREYFAFISSKYFNEY